MKRSPGYSLIEIMMVVTIMGIMSLVGPQLMVQLQTFYLQTTARSEIQRDARATVDVINRFLRQAKYRTSIIDSPASQGPYSRLRFTHVDGRQFEYSQTGNQLVQKVDTKQTVLTHNLMYLAFTFPRSDYPRLVSVSITMQKQTYKSQKKVLELTVQKIRVMN